ncbi:MAG: hypothetical protein WDO13_13035 [Verrucomicrobiota bacterium]
MNCSVMTELPSELIDVICCRPGTWPNCRSSGAVTEEAITSGLAPGVEGDHLHGRVVDLRQRGDGQLRVGRAARQQDGAMNSVVATGRRMKVREGLMKKAC